MTRSDVADRSGIPAAALSNHDLNRELASLHRTRHDTFVHGSAHALANHDQRSRELEREFLHRFPGRDPDPRRLRPAR
ncbi:DUF6158 family protein [Catellatospora bangladeshensis]|jgi:hypothetical protein|uniref:Uncharacterized protein n=1 Tax=Catellatospora bangladeshensis TaxID=310355 RepID=A0A8J3JKC9_9ACTN|nr:DUF6158 family protein [Catellatospora bangladeshensis]GIF84119.1 hypothetical protein Cba03nite_54680 [Catellatospora bangladeshensis]